MAHVVQKAPPTQAYLAQAKDFASPHNFASDTMMGPGSRHLQWFRKRAEVCCWETGCQAMWNCSVGVLGRIVSSLDDDEAVHPHCPTAEPPCCFVCQCLSRRSLDTPVGVWSSVHGWPTKSEITMGWRSLGLRYSFSQAIFDMATPNGITVKAWGPLPPHFWS